MKKMRYLGIIFLLICLGYIVTIYDFAKGVHDSTKDNIVLHKNFMKSFSAEGIIVNKEYCSDCKENNYQIIIELDNFNIDSISLGNRIYAPYYIITLSQLRLTVNQSIYNNVSIGDNVIKSKNSDELRINGKKYLFLSKSTYNWLPST